VKAKNISVTLQKSTPTASGTGQPVDSWATYAVVMASVVTLRGNAYYAAEQTANETALEMYIWYRTDVKAKHRALIDGVAYEVATPPENLNMENRELLIRLRHVE
jgi:SPP1 family predicted phage head-tail adaptor